MDQTQKAPRQLGVQGLLVLLRPRRGGSGIVNSTSSA
jgi:hypothetical protein